MKKHYAQYFREVIEGQKRTIEVLSSVVKDAEKSASEMREKYLPEQIRRMKAERALHEANLELVRLKLENQELRDRFIDQDKLQDALSEAKSKIKKLEKELNRRSGLEDPYGLATPSSKKVNKANSNPENIAKRCGANKGHKGHGRKDFSPHEADREIYLDALPESCPCGGDWVKIEEISHSVYHYIPAKLEKRIYYKNVCACSRCGEKVVGKTPGVMPNSLYSNSMVAGLLEDAFGKIIEAFRFCKLVHADETGWMMDGKKACAWIFANDIFKAFLFRGTRGLDFETKI